MLSFPTRSQCWSFLHSLNPTLSYKISILSFPTRYQSCPFLQDINPVFSWNLLILPFTTRSLSCFFSSTCKVSPFLPLSSLFPPPPNSPDTNPPSPPLCSLQFNEVYTTTMWGISHWFTTNCPLCSYVWRETGPNTTTVLRPEQEWSWVACHWPL